MRSHKYFIVNLVFFVYLSENKECKTFSSLHSSTSKIKFLKNLIIYTDRIIFEPNYLTYQIWDDLYKNTLIKNQ